MSKTIDNDPESRNLDAEEMAIFDAARAAVTLLKKTFDTWVVIGRAVVAARTRADRLGGGKTFRRILEQQGLAAVVPPATATRLEAIMAKLVEVESWRAKTLTENQRFQWASPSAVFKHCPAFAKDREARRPKMPRKVSKNSVEAAVDTIADYCEDLAADEKATLLGRLGVTAAMKAKDEVAGLKKQLRQAKTDAENAHAYARSAGPINLISDAANVEEAFDLVNVGIIESYLAGAARLGALEPAYQSILLDRAGKTLKELTKDLTKGAHTDRVRALVAQLAERIGVKAAQRKVSKRAKTTLSSPQDRRFDPEVE
jgi:hypothetical protein